MITLDDESSLQIFRKHTHPFLAEYDRKLRIYRHGRALAAFPYAKDTGGGFPMEARLRSDGTRRVLEVADHFGKDFFDLKTGREIQFTNVLELPPTTKHFTVGRRLEVELQTDF